MAEQSDIGEAWNDHKEPQEESEPVEQNKEETNNNETSNEFPESTPVNDNKGSGKIDIQSLYINSSVKQPQKESDGQNAFISYLIETEVSIRN